MTQIEKVFGNLCQGCSGVYLINVQQVLQKVTSRKTKLCSELGVESRSGHSCSKCGYVLNGDQVMDVFHDLPSKEVNLHKEVKMVLIYIASYMARKDPASDDSFVYVQE